MKSEKIEVYLNGVLYGTYYNSFVALNNVANLRAVNGDDAVKVVYK